MVIQQILMQLCLNVYLYDEAFLLIKLDVERWFIELWLMFYTFIKEVEKGIDAGADEDFMAVF